MPQYMWYTHTKNYAVIHGSGSKRFIGVPPFCSCPSPVRKKGEGEGGRDKNSNGY